MIFQVAVGCFRVVVMIFQVVARLLLGGGNDKSVARRCRWLLPEHCNLLL